MSVRPAISTNRSAFGSASSSGTLPDTGVIASTFNSGERSARKIAIASSIPGSVSRMMRRGTPGAEGNGIRIALLAPKFPSMPATAIPAEVVRNSRRLAPFGCSSFFMASPLTGLHRPDSQTLGRESYLIPVRNPPKQFPRHVCFPRSPARKCSRPHHIQCPVSLRIAALREKIKGVSVDEKKRDLELGMGRAITRRDFLNGFSVAVGSSLVAPHSKWFDAFGLPQSPLDPEKDPKYYPPSLTGIRGSHEGSFEVGHAARDGEEFANPTPDNEKYDLIIVGGGISGLAAAHFYRKQAGPTARILIIENHDDFGGHAKRNEFQSGDRFLIGYGGTQAIASPKLYSAEAMGLLRELGVEVDRFDEYFDSNFFKSRGMSRGVFFSKEVFGSDRLVTDVGKPSWPEYLAKTPLSADAQKDIARLQAAKVDYLPGMNREQKKVHLARTSYKDFLLNDVKVHPDVIPYFQTGTYGLYGVGIDAVPAGDVAFLGAAGFSGMDLSGPPGPGIGAEVTMQDPSAPYIN